MGQVEVNVEEDGKLLGSQCIGVSAAFLHTTSQSEHVDQFMVTFISPLTWHP